MAVDLNMFCYKGEKLWLKERVGVPWSEGVYSYASDGSIIIRVLRIPEISENILAPIASKLDAFNMPPINAWFPVPDITPEKEICNLCDGIEPYCEECETTGYIDKKIVVEIEEVFFNNKYLRMLLTLPDVKMALIDKIGASAKFRFDGGEGLLMPMRYPGYYDDVEIVKPSEI